MLRFALVVFCCLFLAAPTWAGFDDGVAAYDRHDYKTAIQEFRPLAERGLARAQAVLGRMYASGEGVPQDKAEGMNW